MQAGNDLKITNNSFKQALEQLSQHERLKIGASLISKRALPPIVILARSTDKSNGN